jgi:crossover junction endodeoxyribonuclease RuvC
VIVLGVDPGAVSAAWAAYDLTNHLLTAVGDVPVVDRQVDAVAWTSVVANLQAGDRRILTAVVERVGSMPKQGVSSTFRFGVGCGLLRGVLAALTVPIVDVSPTVWKRWFKLDADPERARAMAIRSFPHIQDLSRKKDHNRAEALLIARWFVETQIDPV